MKVIALIASRTPSLTPRPLSPTPPNGVSSVRQPGTSRMLTVPARSSLMQRLIARQSNVQTPLESAYGRRVGDRDRLVEVCDADDRGDRAERLAGDQAALGTHVVEHRRCQLRAVALAAVEQLGAVGDGVVDALLDRDRGALVDHGADVGLGVERGRRPQRRGAGGDPLGELVGDRIRRR